MRTIKLCSGTPHRHTTLLEAIHRTEHGPATVRRAPRPTAQPAQTTRPQTHA